MMDSIETKFIPIPTPREKPFSEESEIVLGPTFLFKNLHPNEVRKVGDFLILEFFLTYTPEDGALLNEMYESEAGKSEKDLIDATLNDKNLSSGEQRFIEIVRKVIVQLNGVQIGEGLSSPEDIEVAGQKRIKLYKNSDLGKKISLSTFKDSGLVMCAESSMICQALADNLTNYSVFFAEVVLTKDKKEEAHAVNLLVSDDKKRVILVDYAMSIPTSIKGKKIGVPFAELLSDEQVKELLEGKTIHFSNQSSERKYRIGNPFLKEASETFTFE